MLGAYQQDHDAYPQEMGALVPNYVPELPSPRCFAPFRWFRRSDRSQTWFPFHGSGEFGLRECSREGVTVLTVPSVEFDFIQRCNVTTGHWSRVSAFDGACAYVR